MLAVIVYCDAASAAHFAVGESWAKPGIAVAASSKQINTNFERIAPPVGSDSAEYTWVGFITTKLLNTGAAMLFCRSIKQYRRIDR
jgi:hypothetical protein